MNKPSERIVVFVTPAQKRAISATAEGLGISISELMRRAVIAFSATGEQVKAASIVDRLNAPREPDALAMVLRKASRPLRPGRAAPRGGLAPQPPAEPDGQDDADRPRADTGEPAADTVAASLSPSTPASSAGPATPGQPDEAAEALPALPDSASSAASNVASTAPLVAQPDVREATHEIAQAIARLGVRAAEASPFAEPDDAAPNSPPSKQTPSSLEARARVAPRDDANGHRAGPAPEDGHFA